MLEALAADTSQALGTAKEVLEGILDHAGSLDRNTREILSSPRRLIDRVEQEVGPLSQSIQQAAGSIDTAFDNVSSIPDHQSPSRRDRETAVRNVAAAAKAVQTLAEELERNPEPLAQNIGRVVAENRSVALETDRVFLSADRRRPDTDYVLQIDVVRFDLDLEGESLLIARWSLLDGPRERELLVARSAHATPVPQRDYDTIVSAMNRNPGLLTGEIAVAIASLARGKPS